MSFFNSLRGKLTLTYTFVTVLALLALEAVVLLLLVTASSLMEVDKNQYLADVVYTLSPQANDHLQPGDEDIPGLQRWLDNVYADGRASEEPQTWADSPAAIIVRSDPMYVLTPDSTVLAQSPRGENNLIGRRYAPPDEAAGEALQTALSGDVLILSLYAVNGQGKYFVAVPVFETDSNSDVVGVIVLTVEPAPPLIVTLGPVLLGSVLVTGIMLLIAVAPFGTLFGFIMSRGLTRRLRALSAAADAWSEGDFRPFPQDRSKDELGSLGLRLRNMAERIQTLLQSEHELALLEERNRISRELHDTVKQQTFATLMQVRAAKNLLATDPQAAREHLEAAEGLIKTSQQELGLMIAEMRPAALEGQGLPAALHAYLNTWSQHTRIPGELLVQNERKLPLETEQALYRITQEALSNVARHSRASAVTLRLAYEPALTRLVITDNGAGFDPRAQSPGYGLDSMRSRLHALDGSLTVESSPECGTTVTAVVPDRKVNEL